MIETRLLKLVTLQDEITHYNETGQPLLMLGPQAERDALRQRIATEYRDLLELAEAVARAPYDDSDLASLLETLRSQAQAAIAKAKGES